MDIKMAQLHINVPANVKKQAEAELRRHGETLTSKVRLLMYKLARLNQLSDKISEVPKETKPLSERAKQDIQDNSTVTVRKHIKE